MDLEIKKNNYLYATSIIFLIYSIMECLDCILLPLIIFNIIPNAYTSIELLFSVPEIQQLFQSQPIFILPFFWGFTSWRIITTIGLFKNKLWGFWLGIMSLIVTIILDMWFLPICTFEIFACIIILMLLTIGYCGEKPLIKTE